MSTVLQHPERGHELMQFRHSDGLRSLKSEDGDEVPVEFAVAECNVQFLLAVKHPGRGLNRMTVGGDGRSLDDRPAERSFEQAQAAIGLEWIARLAQDAAIA